MASRAAGSSAAKEKALPSARPIPASSASICRSVAESARLVNDGSFRHSDKISKKSAAVASRDKLDSSGMRG